MNKEPKEIIKKLQDYLDLFSKYLKENNFNISGIKIDHICYKCESNEEYERLKSFFEFESKFVYQSIISGRRIAYIGFRTPLISIFGNVFYLELSDQKTDNSQKSKCDHIEPVPNGITYEEMIERFSMDGLEIEENIKPHHSTHDLVLPNGVKIKMSHEPLVNTIYREAFIAE
jgi:predicted metalloenzyme YecM